MSMDRAQYLDKSNWQGSCYELAIEYSPGGNDARLLNALNATWNEPALSGPWLSPDGFLGTDRMPESLEGYGDNHLYGLLDLGDDDSVGCLTVTGREADGSDWLNFRIPVAMLKRVCPVVEPFTRAANQWLYSVDELLVSLGERVYSYYPFNLAIIGHQVSGKLHESNVGTSDLCKGGFLVPPILFERLRPTCYARVLTGGLRWFPPHR